MYAVMRCSKVKSFANAKRTTQHMLRESDVANADPERAGQNMHLMGAKTSDQALGKMRENLPPKYRSNAVLAVEYLMTASPEFWEQATKEQRQDFYTSSMKWLTDKYGEQNVVIAKVHDDETSPHITALVTPVTADGRLSARDYIGGAGKLRKDQTDYAKAVEHLGLFRGVEGSKSTHRSIKDYYRGVTQASTEKKPVLKPEFLQPRVLEKGGAFKKDTMETPDQVAQRVTKAVNDYYAPYVAKALDYDRTHSKEAKAKAKRHDMYKDKAAQLEQQNQRIRAEVQAEADRKVEFLESGHKREVSQLKKELSDTKKLLTLAGAGMHKATSYLTEPQKDAVRGAVAEKKREILGGGEPTIQRQQRDDDNEFTR